MKAGCKDAAVFFYQKQRTRNGREPYAVEEFLFPLPRKSREPFMLYLKPAMLRDGLTTKLLQRLTTASWDARPDGFTGMDLPEELGKSNILSALGPEGRSLLELIDAEQLGLLLHGGDHGILILRCNGDLCSVEYLPHLPGASLLRIWSFIERMVDATSHRALAAR